jgi:hypothetical protein
LYFIDKYKRNDEIIVATKPAYDSNNINETHQKKLAINNILIVFKSSLYKKAIHTHIIHIKPEVWAIGFDKYKSIIEFKFSCIIIKNKINCIILT